MTRRPGLLAASLFSMGAFLGLATSAAFLEVDENRIRDAAMANISAPGPLADVLFETLEQRDVFGVVADEVRADQRRNLAIGVVVATAAAAGVGLTISRGSRRPGLPASSDRIQRADAGLAPSTVGSAEST